MGLLSLLQGWGAQPQGPSFMPGEWDWQRQWGMPFGAQSFGGQSPGLDPKQFGQSGRPAATMPTPDENGITAPAPNLAQQIGSPSSPPLKPPGMMDRFSGFMSPDNQSGMFGPGMQMALSLLGQGSNGGDWGKVGEDVRGIQQAQAQNQAQRFQQQVAAREMQRREKGYGREDQEYAALDSWLQKLPPDQQAWARGNPKAAYEAFAGTQAQKAWGQPKQLISDGYVWTQGADGTLQRGEEIPMTAGDRARVAASYAGSDRRNHLTPLQITNARGNFAAAQGLKASYGRFVDMLKNASPQALAGIGPDGAALQSAHTLLSIQAKSPAALDLGALVGADFTLLGNALGEPGDIKQLVKQGGKDGALKRIAPFGVFLDQSASRLRSQYEPFSDQLSDFYAETAPPLPANAPPTPATASEPLAELPPASNYREGATAVDQKTGRKVVVKNGRWVAVPTGYGGRAAAIRDATGTR